MEDYFLIMGDSSLQCEHYEWLWTAIPTSKGQSGASDQRTDQVHFDI